MSMPLAPESQAPPAPTDFELVRLTGHVCRWCQSPMVQLIDRKAFQCASCGEEAATVEGVCCCGMVTAAGDDMGVRCGPTLPAGRYLARYSPFLMPAPPDVAT